MQVWQLKIIRNQWLHLCIAMDKNPTSELSVQCYKKATEIDKINYKEFLMKKLSCSEHHLEKWEEREFFASCG